jgi:leucyl aminopeptidase
LPIDIRLTAIPAPAEAPLASYFGVAVGEAPASEDIVVAVQDAGTAGPDPSLGGPAADLLTACAATGGAGDLTAAVARLGGEPRRLLFLGLGEESAADMRAAGAALGRRATPGGRMRVCAVRERTAEAVRAFTEGLLLGAYRFSLAAGSGPGGEPAGPPGEVRVLVEPGDEHAAAVDEARIVAEAVALARDLSNMPSARKTPAWLADEALRTAAARGLRARIWEPDELAAEGFGGLLAVGSGSAAPPRLIELGYQPPAWAGHVVLVGKGITFDSGGLSLKPAEGMKTMKTDMAGGAAVIAAMSALARLGAAVRVTGLIAAAENMPSGSAMRPGDVITHYGGRTTEVLNTDAEGRLVLADALAYADAVLQPDVLVDIATLTGAARVALGGTMGALYATEDGLAQALLAAAAGSGEPLWRMPLVEDYRDGLESPVADLANVPHGSARRAGSIQAALFLRAFTGGRAWAHLDIAGAARSSAEDGDRAKGATGFGTRLLLRWLTAPSLGLRHLHGRQ